MKKITTLILLSISISCFSQFDTLYKMDGEKLLVNVTEISESTIRYSYPNESFSNVLSKNKVDKIHYTSGRVEDFTSSVNVSITKSCLDWEKVYISKNESEVQGLHEINRIRARATGRNTRIRHEKLQDKAYDRYKIKTAMQGGNVAFIMEQKNREAIYCGDCGTSYLPSVTVTGLAYTTKKVNVNDISFGDYSISRIYVLRPNAFTIDNLQFKQQKISIQENSIIEENGFYKIKLNLLSLLRVEEYTLIYAQEKVVVLSGIHSTRSGKKTYYNLLLVQ